MKRAAAGGDTTQVWIALQMVLMLEGVECRVRQVLGPERGTRPEPFQSDPGTYGGPATSATTRYLC